MIPATLTHYIETEIIPRYEHFDKAHSLSHVRTVIEESLALAKEYDVNESMAYTKRFNPSINGDVSISFRINKKRVSHEFSLKILNVGMRTGMHFYEYNERTSVVEEKDGSGLIPNISYKIYF